MTHTLYKNTYKHEMWTLLWVIYLILFKLW
jgi:hypothetical protein